MSDQPSPASPHLGSDRRGALIAGTIVGAGAAWAAVEVLRLRSERT